MAKKEGKEGKVEQPPVEQPPVEEPPEEVQPKTFTQEEVDVLLADKDKAYQGIQKVVSRKDKELRERGRTPKVSTSGTAQALQEMIGAIEAQATEVGEITPTTQAKLNAARQTLAVIERDAIFERQETVTSEVIADLRNKFEAIGEDPDDPKFDSIWDAVQIAKLSDGNFDRAKGRAERILKVVKPPEDKKPEPKLTDEQKEKVARKWKEEHGELKTHEGMPSGTGVRVYTREQIRNMPIPQYKEERDKIEEAYREGRIKE